MSYVTYLERRAEELGWERGRVHRWQRDWERGYEEGHLIMLLHQLEWKIAPLPDGLRDQVRQLSLAQIQLLGLANFEFQSLGDLQDWLRLNASP